jgi:diamine N-acetyltransferase
MRIEYHLAQHTDTETLIPMMRGLYAYDGSKFDEANARAALAGLLDDPTLGRVWLTLGDGTPIGYVVLCFGYSLEYRGRDAIVDELYLVAQYRDQGIGRQMLSFVEAQCRELGIRALHLEVERANTRAQAVYRRQGFFSHERFLMTKWVDATMDDGRTTKDDCRPLTTDH